MNNGYSGMDRALHRLAFWTYPAQLSIADIETKLYAQQLAGIAASQPVFITGLPRSGTTLLLECCARLPDFASHCYRDMPFALTPCFWNRFSAPFQKKSVESKGRAHGDGMVIDFDSPEALEEVLWATCWRDHYRRDRIRPWNEEVEEEFLDFFKEHMRKIIWLRRGSESAGARYLSKNNGNIARLRLLRRLFPDAVIVIPFRAPVPHAGSLLEQHLNFLRLHEQDSFARAYMEAIGHFEFGQTLRPIDFDGWLDRRKYKDARDPAFWIEYWVAAYGNLLRSLPPGARFMDYDNLCEAPERGLSRLADIVKVRQPGSLLAAASTIRKARPKQPDTGSASPGLLQKASELYENLKEASRS